MRKNLHSQGARASGTPRQGNVAGDGRMPAKNTGDFPVSLGTTHSSKFGHNVKPASAQQGAKQPKGSKAKMPANNVTDRAVKLGNTKHGVGSVPGYLRGSK